MEMKTKKVMLFQNKSVSKYIFIGAMLAFPLIHFAIFWVYINFNTFALTFQKFNGEEFVFPGFAECFDNYEVIFRAFFMPREAGGQIILQNALFNSLYAFLINVVILMPLSIICAYVLSFRIKGEGFFRTVFYIPNIIAITVMIMLYKYMFNDKFGPLYFMFKSFGVEKIWFDLSVESTTIWPLIIFYCIWAGLGVNMILMSSAISRIPPEILESCQLDGIGFWHQLWSIVIPLVWSTISTVIVLGVLAMFNFFIQPYLMAGADGGYEGQTMTIPIYIFNVVQSGSTAGYSTAATVGIFVSIIGMPIIFFTKWLTERFFRDVDF